MDEEGKEECNRIIEILNERLEIHDNSRKNAQNKLHEICEGLRRQVDDLESSINNEIEELFNKEDGRLQTILGNIRENASSDYDDLSKAIERAKAELLVTQSYDVIECNSDEYESDDKLLLKRRLIGSILDFTKMYKLKAKREFLSLKFVDFEKRKPLVINTCFTDKGELSISFAFFNDDEIKALKPFNLCCKIVFDIYEKGIGESNAKTTSKEHIIGEEQQICFVGTFNSSSAYYIKMRFEYQDLSSEWSDATEFYHPTI